MKYERGKHPNSHSKEKQKRVRATQLRNRHPWRVKPVGWTAYNPNYMVE